MFENLLATRNSPWTRARKAMTFSLSLVFHVALLVAVIVLPLLRAEAGLPEYAIVDAALIAPPILPGVPPGRSGRGGDKPGPVIKDTKNPPPARGPRGFMAPVEVPTEIVDEDPTAGLTADTGEREGVEGGSGDGKAPWIYGEEIKPDVFDANAAAVTTVRPPRLIRRVNPDYSPAAIAAHVSGPVVIAAVTDIYGRVREARVVSGHALLGMPALKAVREWIYEPYLVNGIPKPVSFTVTVIFSLENR
jgi:periplasmic protein TonB